MSYSLQPHESQHARPPCPSLCPPLPGKAIKLFFSTSPKTLSLRFDLAPVHRDQALMTRRAWKMSWHGNTNCKPVCLSVFPVCLFLNSFFFNIRIIWLHFFFPFIFISWRLINLQYYSGFCHTLTWISHGFTCIPHPNPPSHHPLHPIPLGLPSAPALSTCLMHPAWAGDLFHPR